MQRLTYSPKAWIFIRRRNGTVADVSRYVTSGSVNRRVNAVSTANFVLRNPNMIFTSSSGKAAAFYPMDPITIYLQRIKDHPVRVFTGYLDETPYYELYPGTIEFSASCTLKRLLYTYFDPALPYTQSFLAKYGWSHNDSGTIYNPAAITGDEVNQDGGMGRLLFATLRDIGGWKDANIKIEELPKDLLDRMANLFKTFNDDNAEAQKELSYMLASFVGAGSYGSSGGGGDVDVSGIKGDVPSIVFRVGTALGVNPLSKLMLSAFETGLVEAPDGDSFGNPDHGSGSSVGWRQETAEAYPGVDRMNVNDSAKRYFQEGLDLIAGKTSGKTGTGKYQSSWTAGMLAQAIQGSAYPDRYDGVKSKAISLRDAIQAKVQKSDTTDSTKKGKKAHTSAVVAHTSSTPPSPNDTPPQDPDHPVKERVYAHPNRPNPSKVLRAAQKESGSSSSNSGSTNTTPTTPTKPDNVDAQNRTKLENPIDVHGALPGMQVIARLADTYGLAVTAGRTDHTTNVAGTNRASDHSWGGALDVSNGTLTPQEDAFEAWVKKNIPGMIKQLIWRDKVQYGDNLGSPVSGHTNHVHIALKQEFASDKTKTLNAVVAALAGTPLKGSAAPTDTGDTASQDQQADELLQQTRATALAINLNWSDLSDTLAAEALQGNKSLMNDKPMMPFIQQMAESSLRQFMSMPNGDFFGFYPDYFGETFHRPPYWLIDDIEILDGRVKLSDDNLITHEYVVGDTIFSNDAGSFANMLASSGDVSIINAFVSDLVDTKTNRDKNNSKDDKKLFHAFNRIMKQDEAVQFLQRYGARPNLETYPMVRHPFFELFLAYQRFMQAWARQFLTPFEFTFMPELYPGGKLGMPQHGLQMYIEEVTHTWDMTSGFTTQADLSAPAVMLDSNGNPLNDNLPTNMPTALLEVAVGQQDQRPPINRPPLADDGSGQQRPT